MQETRAAAVELVEAERCVPPHPSRQLLPQPKKRTSKAIMDCRPVAARAILTALSTASLPLLQ